MKNRVKTGNLPEASVSLRKTDFGPFATLGPLCKHCESAAFVA